MGMFVGLTEAREKVLEENRRLREELKKIRAENNTLREKAAAYLALVARGAFNLASLCFQCW